MTTKTDAYHGAMDFMQVRLATLVQPSPVHLPHVKRASIPAMFKALGFTTGAEIGTWKGNFAVALCQANPALRLTCVDAWAPYEDYLEAKNDAAALAGAFKEAQAKLQRYQCTLLRARSEEAVACIPDGSLDFVYIDGNHLYHAVVRDLELWTPKVRMGGIVSGHDFGTNLKRHIDVERAVRDFTAAHRIEPWFVLGELADLPSFLWVRCER